MFEDFEREPAGTEGRGRRGLSAVLSMGIFGGLAVVLGGAITAHQVHALRKEKEIDVVFEALPKPKAPPPKPAVKSAPKKAAPRKQKLVAVSKIPKDKPPEAEGELRAEADTGAVDGIVQERPRVVAVAPPPPPVKPDPPPPPPAPQERESVTMPRFVSGCRAPDAPPGLQKSAATIVIDVRMLIGPRGEVVSARILQPHPLVPDDLVLGCARRQVFEPARLPDGTAVPFPTMRRFVFRPSQV